MIYCVCSASFKIFSINCQIDNEEVEDFTKDIFIESGKITVADLIRKVKENKKIQAFMEVILDDKQVQREVMIKENE